MPCPHNYENPDYCKQCNAEDEIARLLHDIKRLQADANRYQWLLKTSPCTVAAIAYSKSRQACKYSEEHAGKAIDAAMKAEKWHPEK